MHLLTTRVVAKNTQNGWKIHVHDPYMQTYGQNQQSANPA